MVFFPLFIAATNRPPGERAVIVEISVACGFIGLAMLALEFALISHLRPVAMPFGMDALIQFHRELGTMALVFVLAHPILLILNGLPLSTLNPFGGTPATQLGVIALISMLLIVGLSYGRKRPDFKFEYWQLTHGLLSIAAFVFAIGHMAKVDRYFSIPAMAGLWDLYAFLLVGLLLDRRVAMAVGDTLLLYTDGVTEARSGEEFFGSRRLLEVFGEEAAGESAQAAVDALFARVMRFSGSALKDDLAIAAIVMR